MTLSYRKKLIEVALPLAAINAESAREKSIRHGHPSTLHLWWARRPLAACRAVLFASLVDDPDSDPAYRKADGSVDEDAAGIKRADLFNLIEELVMWENSNNPDVIRTARAEIARCVASRLIETGVLKKDAIIGLNTMAYDLMKLGHCKPIATGLDKKVGRVRFSFDVSKLPPAEVVNTFLAEHAPPVLDPFAGGGSIPLEAQRLGLRAYASDLNPVPVLINKALIEIPPKFAGRPPVNPQARGEWTEGKGRNQKSLIDKKWPGATGLAEDVRYYGRWMRDEAEKRIGHLYPKVEVTHEMAQDRPDLLPYVGQQLTVIAWLWARTVASPDPAVRGSHVPLVKSFWLSKRKGKQAWIEPIVNRTANHLTFAIRQGSDGPQITGTVNRKGGTCIISSNNISFDYIRKEGKAGRLRFALMAIAAEGRQGRVYLPPSEEQARIAATAEPSWIPDADLPYNPFSVRPPLYGLNRFCDLFTDRQLTALSMFSGLIGEVRQKIIADATQGKPHSDERRLVDDGFGPIAYADAIATYLSFAIDKLVDLTNTGCLWEPVAQCPRNLFGRQALPMHWNFAEANAFGNSSGSFSVVLDNAFRNLTAALSHSDCSIAGSVNQSDAAEIPATIPAPMISTDPPYYNNIDYADLSDFFYVWLRRSLGGVFGEIVKTVLTPKVAELVATPYRFDGSREAAKDFFEKGLSRVFVRFKEVHDQSLPLTIFYAFKQSEQDENENDSTEDDEPKSSGQVSTGWETMLEGLIAAGLGITGTWPIRTELTSALKDQMNSLASSIVLVCSNRPDNASLTTRKDFIAALRRELPDSLRNLQRGNIAPVDLAQAAIGPGMAVFTRYSKVLESNGSPLNVRTALGIINQVLDEVLAEQEGEFDGDTRWALAWFEQFGIDEGPYGIAETLSKAKNTAVKGLEEAGIVKAKGGKVKLIGRAELPEGWDPTTDKRLTVWETTQHLIHTLDTKGEPAAAVLLGRLGGIGDAARDLAYRLYSICERKKWADEALAYNSLVIAWPELSKLALAERSDQSGTQGQLF